MKRKDVATSEDDFRILRENDCYYVDKTLLIKEFLNNKGARVTLITRPRRFGKTLNMTMMREFFDITKDSKDIFEGTKIMDTEYASKMNSIPVIYFSFKNCEGDTKEELVESFRDVLIEEYSKYYEIFKDDIEKIAEMTQVAFMNNIEILKGKSDYQELRIKISGMIFVLSKAVYEYYNIKPIIIVDEYDYPFIEARTHGYYDEVRGMLSGIFSKTFKGNNYLDKAILTGIQRIVQESIFSKFNNPSICTVTDEAYSDKFGLTEDETRQYLEYFGLELNEKVKEYYDGYKFYETDIYNPMSITMYIFKKGKLGSYWVNTSSNQLIKDEIRRADKDFYESFDELIKEGVSEVGLSFSITFSEYQSTETLWGLLVNAGYITVDNSYEFEEIGYAKVRIPNKEVRNEFQNIIASMMEVTGFTLNKMFNALINKKIDTFATIYKKIVMNSTSFFDSSEEENSYHMLMLGMCAYLQPRFNVVSNIEKGIGRSDISIYAKRKNDLNVIIEFKYTKDKKEGALKKEAEEARKQIENNMYYSDMEGDVLIVGIAHRIKEAEIVYKLLER